MKMSKTLYVTTRQVWRSWLRKNYNKSTEIWLLYYKRDSGKPRIPYNDAVEEALAFGWIDSLVQRIDSEKYAQEFTPRKKKSKWSLANRKRVVKLFKAGKMTEAGLAKVDFPLVEIEEPVKSSKSLTPPRFMADALRKEKMAFENYKKLPPSQRRLYILWITAAKKDETRQRRLHEAIELLNQNKKLGLK